MVSRVAVLGLVGVAACAVDSSVETDEVTSELTSANRLSANRLSANRLSANRLSANSLSASSLETAALAATEDGRDVLSYIVSCALPTGSSVELAVDDIVYSFPGSIGLAPGWATGTPTVAERHWVTACVLARTNLYGISVQLSIRGAHPALKTTTTEMSQYSLIEGAFYGDLFDPNGPQLYACETMLTSQQLALSTLDLRACTLPSDDGVTTRCGFTYSGLCGTPTKIAKPACTKTGAPYGDCRSGFDASGVWSEVITVALANR